MHIREGAANGIKLVVICKHIHVHINSISQIILEDIPDERSKYRALWASPGHPLPLAHYRLSNQSKTPKRRASFWWNPITWRTNWSLYENSKTFPITNWYVYKDWLVAETSPLVFRGKEQLSALILEVFPSLRNLRAATRVCTQRLNTNWLWNVLSYA